jgi:hypothetical protein
VKVELRSSVVAVLRCTLMATTGSWGTGDTRGVRGRSQVEEKPSVGRAHREGWEDGSGGLGFGCWCFSCGSSQRRRGALQHEGAEGSERSTTKRRENKHGWSSPRWGTNDSGSDFDGAKGSPAEGMDKMQLGGAYEAVACFTLRKKHG